MKTRIISLGALIVLTGSSIVYTSGCAATSTRGSSGEYAPDTSLASRVRSALVRDPSAQVLPVNVTESNGVIILSGWVANEQQKVLAEQIARTVPGVQAVQNQILVRTSVVR